MSESYISVSQINTYIKNIFEAEVMLQNICVFGEVGSFNISNGNAYFNLKDENGMLPCVLFGASKFDNPKIGDMVLVRGSISYYAKGGRLSFNAYSIMPYGRGMLFEKFMKLKSELEARGYFDPDRKKTIPTMVRRIGVVSSPTGAVIRDIIDVTTRRNNSIDIVLYPVKVQGVGADREIASGIDFFSNYDNVDVVIVARGGGSMEDLEPFNTEIVANATYNCKKPIVSAVGHETDFTIIDFVSDLRAPTPSAAAELVAWDKNHFVNKILSLVNTMGLYLDNNLTNCYRDINYNMQIIENVLSNFIVKYEKLLEMNLIKLNTIDTIVDKEYNRLEKLNLLLENYNPNRIALMGYSKVIKDDKVISSSKELKIGDDIKISMIDGNVDCKVTGVM